MMQLLVYIVMMKYDVSTRDSDWLNLNQSEFCKYQSKKSNKIKVIKIPCSLECWMFTKE